MNPTIRRPHPSEERAGYVHAAGTEVKVLEALGDGAAWLVEVRVPDENLVGGAWYDCIEVALDDLVLEPEAGADIAAADRAVDHEEPLALDVPVPAKSNVLPRKHAA